MERFKTESAHAVNNLLGREKRTVWCKSYDEPVILDKAMAIDKLTRLELFDMPRGANLLIYLDTPPQGLHYKVPEAVM
jgi:hypothetical protein